MERSTVEIPALQEEIADFRFDVPEGERASVLIVDDNVGKRTSLAAIVASMNLEVAAASSAREALRHLLKRDFALILLDVRMPIMDGYETARMIHSRPRSMHTPIIFVTAEADSEDERSKGYTIGGAVDWIYSPVVREVLQAKVKVFVNLFYLNSIARLQAEELLRHSEEISRKNLQLEEASKLKSSFFANMSHELRTPLNAIIGFSELLKDGLAGELSQKQNDYIAQIFNSGRHLLALINDILDLSKIEAGRMTLDLEEIGLNELLQACLAIVMDKAIKRNIALKFDACTGNDRIVADPRKLRQIVYNLLSNAVKFTPDCGEILLSAHLAKGKVLSLAAPQGMATRLLPLSASEFEDFLEIRVSDNGIGMRSDDLPHLFQTFRQIDSSLTRQHEGTGLGLALVSRLADLHAGTVGVASAPQRGTHFVVWLPWRKSAVAASQFSAPGEKNGAHTDH